MDKPAATVGLVTRRTRPEVAPAVAPKEPPPRSARARDAELRRAKRELETLDAELRRTDQELARVRVEATHARQRADELFEYAPVAYVVTDALGRITAVNLAAASLLGLDRPRVVGRPFASVLDPSARSRLRAALLHLRAMRAVEPVSARLVATAGRASRIVATPRAEVRSDGTVARVRWGITAREEQG